MVILVLDTSVVLKWFKEERYAKIALKIKDEFVKGVHEIVVPDLILYEMANAMKYTEGFNTKLIKDSLTNFVAMDINIVTPTEEVMNLAIELAYKYGITIYDSVFVSLAKLIDATFVTADETLYEKVKDLKFVKFITEFKS